MSQIDELLLMSKNIYHLYQKMIKEKENAKAYQKYLDYLDLALEYEEKLYKQIDINNLDNLYFPFRDAHKLITYPIQERIHRIPKDQLPQYRILFHLKHLKEYYQEIDIGDLKHLWSPETVYVITRDIKYSQIKGMILNQQFYINYLNTLFVTKENSIEDYYHMIYLNKFLEKELRFDAFQPVSLEESFDYITKVWSILPISDKIREEFNHKLLLDLRFFLNTPSIPKSMDETYLFACFFQLTTNQKIELMKEIELILSSPLVNSELKQRALNFRNKYIKLVSQNLEEVYSRKKF